MFKIILYIISGVLISMLFGLNSSFATFTLAGTTITQTGTDDTASFITAMSGISGVTVTSHGNTSHSTFTIVDFGDRSLYIDGDFDLDFNRMQFIFSGTDATDRLYARGSSNFYMRSPQTQNGFSFNPEMGQVLFAIESDTVSWNSRTLRVDAGSNAEFIGVTFKGEFSTWLYGTTLVENCIVEKIGNTGDIQFNVQNNVTLRNVKMYASGQTGVTFRGDSRNVIVENVQVYGARDSFNNESSFDVLVEKLDSDTGGIADISQFSGKRHIIKNAKNGTVFVWANHLNGGSPTNYNSGRVEVLQTVSPIGFDSTGIAVPGFKFYIEDNPINGNNLSTLVFDGQLASQKRVYLHTSDTGGIVAPFDVLIGAGQSNLDGQGLNGIIKTRGVNTTSGTQNTDDLYLWSAIEYLKTISSATTILKGISGTDVSIIFGDDTSITEVSKSIVDSYTTINTSLEFYDRAKGYLYDNFSGETTTLVNRSGETIDAGSYDVVIDATASQAFAFDGTTITIKSIEYDGNITTSGSVIFLNGAGYKGVVGDNSGTTSLLSLTDMPADSYVYVMDNTGTTFDYSTGQVGEYSINIPSTATGSWTYAVKKPGYLPQTSSFIPMGGEYSIPINLSVQYQSNGVVMYNASTSSLIDVEFTGIAQLNIDVADGSVSNQEAYDMVEKSLVTQEGMRWIAEGNGGITISDLSSGSYVFLTDDVRFRRNAPGDANATVSSFAVSTQGTIIDNVNGGVQFLTAGAGDVTIDNADKEEIATLVKTNMEVEGGLMDNIYTLLEEILTWLQSIKGDSQKIE